MAEPGAPQSAPAGLAAHCRCPRASLLQHPLLPGAVHTALSIITAEVRVTAPAAGRCWGPVGSAPVQTATSGALPGLAGPRGSIYPCGSRTEMFLTPGILQERRTTVLRSLVSFHIPLPAAPWRTALASCPRRWPQLSDVACEDAATAGPHRPR